MTEASPQKKAPKRSIRTQILAVAMLPTMITGGVWFSDALNTQTAQMRQDTVQGVRAGAESMSARLQDLATELKVELDTATLAQPAFQNKGNKKLQEITNSSLTVQRVIVADQKGNVRMNATTNSEAPFSSPEFTRIISTMASRSSESGTSAVRDIDMSDGTYVAASTPLKGGAGSVVMISRYNAGGLSEISPSLQRTIMTISLMMLATILMVSLVVSGLVRRIRRIEEAAERISQAQDVSELQEPITDDRNDELSSVAHSINRLQESNRIMLEHM